MRVPVKFKLGDRVRIHGDECVVTRIEITIDITHRKPYVYIFGDLPKDPYRYSHGGAYRDAHYEFQDYVEKISTEKEEEKDGGMDSLFEGG